MHFPHMNLITGKFFVETLHEERIISDQHEYFNRVIT